MTAPTREQVVAWFHEAGDSFGWKPGVGNDLVISYMEHFAALAYAAGQAAERSAMPPPPLVIDNPDVAKVVAVAVRTEREACAAHMEAMCNKSRDARFRSALTIAAGEIRARGES